MKKLFNVTKPFAYLTAAIVMALMLVGCATKSNGESDAGDFADTNVIDHTQGIPSAKIATLTMTNDYPVFDYYYITPGDVLDIVYNLERELRNTRFEITLYHRLKVSFIGSSELNVDQDVLPDGTITLPYLGPYTVLGKSTIQLKTELEKEYSRYLRYPEVLIEIKNINARVEQIRTDLRTAGRGLSKLVTVRQDGYASFPLIGEIYVAKRTIADVSGDLINAYGKYMPGLKSNLFLHEQAGTNIYVMGEVQEPGAIEMNRPVNVVQAIAMAGGYTRQGQTEYVVVFRRDKDRLHAHRFNLKDMDQYGAHAISFFLRPEDIVLVPRSKVSSLAQLMSEIADITFFRGLGISYEFKP